MANFIVIYQLGRDWADHKKARAKKRVLHNSLDCYHESVVTVMLGVARANDRCVQLGLPHNWVQLQIRGKFLSQGNCRSCVYCERGKERIGYHKLDVLPATLALERLPSHGQTQ